MLNKEKETPPVNGVPSGYWELERIVAWSFNRLKGKIYNLVEASVEYEERQKAVKGLIKGFANDEYKLCVEEIKWHAIKMGIIKEEETQIPRSAEPLENKNGIFG